MANPSPRPQPQPPKGERPSVLSGLLSVVLLLVIVVITGGAALFGVRYYAYGEMPAQVVGRLRGETEQSVAPAAHTRTAPRTPPPPSAPQLPAPTGPMVRVLFIGNSLTYANDLPGMVRQMAWAAGINMQFAQATRGGAKLSDQAADVQLAAKIREGGWNVVVLQEQSQLPALDDAFVRQRVAPPAGQLVQMVRAANPSAIIVFYDAMAWRDGDAVNSRTIPAVGTYEGMQSRANRTYVQLAREHRGVVAPVGQAWQVVRRERPTLNLYGDERHPNVAGTYLAASVFFGTLFHRSPLGSAFTAGLDGATARYMQAVAQLTVFEGGEWDFGR